MASMTTIEAIGGLPIHFYSLVWLIYVHQCGWQANIAHLAATTPR